MSRKRGGKTNTRVIELTEALINNGYAMHDGPRRKTWTKHDLKTIKPLTPTQEEMFHDFFAGKHICAHGSAGTGKTFIALYLALNEMLRAQAVEHIIIVRSAVPTREMGYMKGDLVEKEAHYELPYAEMFAEILGRPSSYQDMKDTGVVRFCTTSYVRGLTWNNAVIVVDEVQNMNFHEINSIITRLGKNSRIIFAGDLPQTDLRKRHDVTGMGKLIEIVATMPEFSVIHFTHHDIVRSEFVKRWIIASEQAAA